MFCFILHVREALSLGLNQLKDTLNGQFRSFETSSNFVTLKVTIMMI